MRKFTITVAAILMAASLNISASDVVKGMYDDVVEYSLDTVTGTTVFTISDIMDDQFAFYFNQDYCTNVTPYVHLEYESGDKKEFTSIVLEANGQEYFVDLHSSMGVHKKASGGYHGVYDSFYKNNTALLVEAFDDPELTIELYSRDGTRTPLNFNYELNKQIVDVYKNHAKYKGYF